MNDLKPLLKSYKSKVKRYGTTAIRLAKERDEALRRYNGLKYPHWKENLIVPIAEEIAKRLDRDYEILGPFGLGCEMSIHFMIKGLPDQKKDYKAWYAVAFDDMLSLTFRPGDIENGELKLVDLRKNTGKFPEGSIGEVNGMNHPRLPMPETIDDLIKFMKSQK